MGGVAGIIGSAIGGAVDVMAPVVQQQAIDKSRARQQQSIEELRAQIQAKRDAALFAHQEGMAADARAFTGEQNELSRGLQEQRLGLLEGQMQQGAEQFEQTHSFAQQKHADQMALDQEKLELLKQGGGSQAQSGDMQMISFLQSQLGKSPEEAFSMWKETKNDPNKFIEQYVLSKVKAQQGDPFASIQNMDKPQQTPEQMAEEARRALEAIRGEQRDPEPPPETGRRSSTMFKFLGFEE